MPVGRILIAAAILIASSAAAAPVKIGVVNSMTGPEIASSRRATHQKSA